MLDINEYEPVWTGHGCIQVRVSETLRFNFWTDVFPHIDRWGGKCHDHRFKFQSTVLRGCLSHNVYAFKVAPVYGDFTGWQRQTEHQYDPARTFVECGRYSLSSIDTKRYVRGCSYTFGGLGRWHIVEAVPGTVTMLVKTSVDEFLDPVIITDGRPIQHALNAQPGVDSLREEVDRIMRTPV